MEVERYYYAVASFMRKDEGLALVRLRVALKGKKRILSSILS